MKNKKKIIILSVLSVILCIGLGTLFFLVNRNGFVVKNKEKDQIVYYQKGKKLYGKQKIDGETYYFNEKTGYLYKGFFNKNNITYYADGKGRMAKGLTKIKSDNYYFDNDFAMLKERFIDIEKDNKKHTSYFGTDGKMVYGLTKIKNDVYYFNNEGAMIKNKKIDIKVNNKNQTSYFDTKGRMVYGLQKINNQQYYFEKDGSLVKNTTKVISIDGVEQNCKIDEKGVIRIIKENKEPEVPQQIQVSVPKELVSLKQGVQSIIQRYGGTTSVYFKDLTGGEGFLLNDVTMYPCCMIKIATLGTFMQQVEKGAIDYNSYINYIHPMIIVSDNTSYNKVMRGLGNGDGQKGAELVRNFASSIGMRNTGVYHGLRPGNDYFPGISSNVSCASDIGVFFEKLYYGQIVNPQRCQEMINILLQCDDDEGIMQGLPSTTAYASKTGEAYECYHDGGIVYAPNRPYVLVIFSDGVGNNRGMMKEVSSYIYNYQMNQK